MRTTSTFGACARRRASSQSEGPRKRSRIPQSTSVGASIGPPRPAPRRSSGAPERGPVVRERAAQAARLREARCGSARAPRRATRSARATRRGARGRSPRRGRARAGAPDRTAPGTGGRSASACAARRSRTAPRSSAGGAARSGPRGARRASRWMCAAAHAITPPQSCPTTTARSRPSAPIRPVDVGGERPQVVRAARLRAAVPAQVGRDRAEARRGERGQLVPPRARELGEAVQEQHERTVLRPVRERRELDPVRAELHGSVRNSIAPLVVRPGRGPPAIAYTVRPAATTPSPCRGVGRSGRRRHAARAACRTRRRLRSCRSAPRRRSRRSSRPTAVAPVPPRALGIGRQARPPARTGPPALERADVRVQPGRPSRERVDASADRRDGEVLARRRPGDLTPAVAAQVEREGGAREPDRPDAAGDDEGVPGHRGACSGAACGHPRQLPPALALEHERALARPSAREVAADDERTPAPRRRGRVVERDREVGEASPAAFGRRVGVRLRGRPAPRQVAAHDDELVPVARGGDLGPRHRQGVAALPARRGRRGRDGERERGGECRAQGAGHPPRW